MEVEDAGRFVLMLCRIWHVRNKFVHEGKWLDQRAMMKSCSPPDNESSLGDLMGKAKGSPGGGLKSSLCFILGEIRESSRLLPENHVAHELAQLAKRTTHTAVWRAQVPRCVESLVAHDCNHFAE
ncbi:hypothetical protein EJB05_40545, partial [Eragrostis curvula]